MKPFRNALIEFYPEMKRLDARHKWVEIFVTGNRSIEHHCYECSKCGSVARLTQVTMYGSNRNMQKIFKMVPHMKSGIKIRKPYKGWVSP